MMLSRGPRLVPRVGPGKLSVQLHLICSLDLPSSSKVENRRVLSKVGQLGSGSLPGCVCDIVTASVLTDKGVHREDIEH